LCGKTPCILKTRKEEKQAQRVYTHKQTNHTQQIQKNGLYKHNARQRLFFQKMLTNINTLNQVLFFWLIALMGSYKHRTKRECNTGWIKNK